MTTTTPAIRTRTLRRIGNYFRRMYDGPFQAMYIYVCVYTVYLHVRTRAYVHKHIYIRVYVRTYTRGDNGGTVLMGNRLPTSSETNGIDFRRGRMSGMLSMVL